MNEIVIEDKKYISSKRAAEITGYAKDYVGQLCREGRIEARLIGRNWYILEAAIQDHRFGAEPVAEVEKKEEEKQMQRFSQETWQAPRYEVAHQSDLPVINRLNRPVHVTEEPKPIEDMVESWQHWFNASEEPPVAPELPPEEREPEILETPAFEEVPKLEEESVVINYIHAPPLLNLQKEDVVSVEKELPLAEIDENPYLVPVQGRGGSFFGLTATVFAAVAVIVFVLNTGYFDNFIGKYSEASAITGIRIYKK